MNYPEHPPNRPILGYALLIGFIYLVSITPVSTFMNLYDKATACLQSYVTLLVSQEIFDTFVASLVTYKTQFVTLTKELLVSHYTMFKDVYKQLFDVWYILGVSYLLLCALEFAIESARFAIWLWFLVFCRIPLYLVMKAGSLVLKGLLRCMKLFYVLKGHPYFTRSATPVTPSVTSVTPTSSTNPSIAVEASTNISKSSNEEQERFTIHLKRINRTQDGTDIINEKLRLTAKYPEDVILVKDLMDALWKDQNVVLYRKNIRLSDYAILHHNETLILIPTPSCIYEIK